MGSFRELLGRLEDAHDQELSQLREATCFVSKPVLWFLRRKQINEFPILIWKKPMGFLATFSTLHLNPILQELRHTRWASRKQTLTASNGLPDFFDLKEAFGLLFFYWTHGFCTRFCPKCLVHKMAVGKNGGFEPWVLRSFTYVVWKPGLRPLNLCNHSNVRFCCCSLMDSPELRFVHGIPPAP